MLDLIAQVFDQTPFTMALCALAAGALAYAFTTLLSSWLTGVLLFPGLFTGALAAVELAERLGLVIGRDKESVIIGACFLGLLLTLFCYYVGFNFLLWLTSYNSRAYRALMERAQKE
jgi:hypothetical protein